MKVPLVVIKSLFRACPAVLAIALLAVVAAGVQAANVTFSVQAANVVPSTELETSTPFTLSIYATNNTASNISYKGFTIFLDIAPAIPGLNDYENPENSWGTVKLDGSASPSGAVEFIPTLGGGFSGPADEEFLIDNLIISWNTSSSSTVKTLAPGTNELVRLHLLLVPDAPLDKWNITFGGDTAMTGDSGNVGTPYSFVGGYIATPEPGVMSLLFLGSLGLLRRRRANGDPFETKKSPARN